MEHLLYNWIMGDALGYIYNGLKGAHISSTLKDRSFFPDPLPLVKHKEHLWKKPGLYSALSQLPFFTWHNGPVKSFSVQSIEGSLVEAGEKTLRESDIAIDNGIIMPGNHAAITPLGIIPALAHLGPGGEEHLIPAVSLMTNSTITMNLAFIYLALYRAPSSESAAKAMDQALIRAKEHMESSSPLLFEEGINPQSLGEEFRRIETVLMSMAQEKGYDYVTGLQEITGMTLKTGDIYHPAAGLFQGFNAVLRYDEPVEALISAVRSGGASSLAGITASILLKKVYHYTPEEEMEKDLINRKRLKELVSLVLSGHFYGREKSEFTHQEGRLSAKEREERAARMKSRGDKKKKKKPGNKDLTSVIVESWTKEDKSRWKRERKKLNVDKNN